MEAALPQHRRQFMYHGIAQAHLLTAESVLQRQRQPLRVGHGILQRWRLHGDLRLHEIVAELHTRRFQILLQPGKDGDLLPGGQVSGLHTALVGGRNVRHQHRHIGRHFAGAAQTPAGGIVLVGDVAGLQALHRPLQQLHAALAAGTVAGTGCVDGHIGGTGGLQQSLAGRGGSRHRRGAVFKGKDDLIHVILLGSLRSAV